MSEGYSRRQLVKDFLSAGVQVSDTVMLHASIRRVGKVQGGPTEIIHALQEALGPTGTVMMYVGCIEEYDDVGRGKFSPAQEAHLRASLPAYDYKAVPADPNFGAMAEIFRAMPGTVCSNQLGARMAARGAKAQELMAGHPLQQGYGRGSPLEKLEQVGGKILHLGSDLDHTTFLHYVEVVADFPGKRMVRHQAPLLNAQGEKEWVWIEEFDTSRGAHLSFEEDLFFAKIVNRYIDDAGIAAGSVGQARTYVLDSRGLARAAAPLMQQAAMGRSPFVQPVRALRVRPE